VLGISRSRARSAAVPTLLSITRLLRLLPSAVSESVSSIKTHIASKRAYGEWGLVELAAISTQLAEAEPEAPEDPPGSPQFVWKLVLSVCLVLLGGVFAG
jgi:metal transporter CNNM